MFERTNPRNFLPPRRKGAKESALSFRPKGEILVSSKARNLLLRSLAFARDDGPRPITLAPFALFARDAVLSDLPSWQNFKNVWLGFRRESFLRSSPM